MISEVPVPHGTPHTIDLEWQVLLMEAVRSIDEIARHRTGRRRAAGTPRRPEKTILVIDDSLMLLSFVKEILERRALPRRRRRRRRRKACALSPERRAGI